MFGQSKYVATYINLGSDMTLDYGITNLVQPQKPDGFLDLLDFGVFHRLSIFATFSLTS